MDAITLLKTDHEKVSGIFEKLEETTERAEKTREELFQKLKQELELHSHIEETIFYPVLKKSEETRDITMEGIQEHHVEEEESDMFKSAREVLSKEQLENLGTRMEAEKKQQKAAAAG